MSQFDLTLDQDDEGILPAQFYERARTLSAERRLLFAILDDAVKILQGVDTILGKIRKRTVEDAWQWVQSEDEIWPMAFIPTCHMLGLDPEWVRERIRRKIDQKESETGEAA